MIPASSDPGSCAGPSPSRVQPVEPDPGRGGPVPGPAVGRGRPRRAVRSAKRAPLAGCRRRTTSASTSGPAGGCRAVARMAAPDPPLCGRGPRPLRAARGAHRRRLAAARPPPLPPVIPGSGGSSSTAPSSERWLNRCCLSLAVLDRAVLAASTGARTGRRGPSCGAGHRQPVPEGLPGVHPAGGGARRAGRRPVAAAIEGPQPAQGRPSPAPLRREGPARADHHGRVPSTPSSAHQPASRHVPGNDRGGVLRRPAPVRGRDAARRAPRCRLRAGGAST